MRVGEDPARCRVIRGLCPAVDCSWLMMMIIYVLKLVLHNERIKYMPIEINFKEQIQSRDLFNIKGIPFLKRRLKANFWSPPRAERTQ
jgi:hypothetical protein